MLQHAAEVQMKIIGGLHTPVQQPVASPGRKVVDKPAQSQLLAIKDADTVRISPEAEKMNEDAVRQERLASIREQLAAGTYNISGKDVASKIINALKG